MLPELAKYSQGVAAVSYSYSGSQSVRDSSPTRKVVPLPSARDSSSSAPVSQMSPPAHSLVKGMEKPKRRMRKRKVVLTQGAHLLNEAKYSDASKAYLTGLTRRPGDARMQAGFAVATDSFKFSAPERWAAWPFGGGETSEQRSTGQKPGRLPPPHADGVTMESVMLRWQESPPFECVGGYEVEISEVNGISGPQKWRKVHRGKPFEKLVKPLGRELAGVRARVRAYNSAGRGDWSVPSEMIRLTKITSKEKKEIEEMPSAWLGVDVAGIADLKEDIDPNLLAMTRKELLTAMHKHKTVIMILFRYYALAGVTSVDDDPSTMTLIQFGNFCSGVKIIDKRLSMSDTDRIFLRAVRVVVPDKMAVAGGGPKGGDGGGGGNGLAAMASSSGIKVSKFTKAKAAVNVSALITKGSNLMNQTQFVGALIRISDARYPEQELSIGDKLERLCADKLNYHAFEEMRLISDDFQERFRSRILQAALVKHGAQLVQIFAAYSKADVSSVQSRKTMSTMNVLEANSLLEDVGLFDKSFGVRELLAAFVRVNIEDDLYYQDQSEDSSTELVFDEFEEFIARIFFEAVWSRLQAASSTADLLDQDGDGDLDDDDIDDLFNECDVDNSGTVTVDELTGALEKRLNATAAKLFAEQLLKIADEDKSGSMDREELASAVRKMREMSANGKERPGDMERAFDEWLGTNFVPPALKGAAKKKLLVLDST